MMKQYIIYQSSPSHSPNINFLQFCHQPDFFVMQVYNNVCIEKLHMRVVGNVQSCPSFSSPLLLLINCSLIFVFLTIISQLQAMSCLLFSFCNFLLSTTTFPPIMLVSLLFLQAGFLVTFQLLLASSSFLCAIILTHLLFLLQGLHLLPLQIPTVEI